MGDALTVLKTLPAESVHCCVTSPPYWGLRDYGTAAERAKRQFRETYGKCGTTRQDFQLGLERTADEYVENMVEVFREVRRVLRDDGTLASRSD